MSAVYVSLPRKHARDLALKRFELSYLTLVLRIHRGSVSAAAAAMRVARQALYKAMKRIGMDPGNFRF